MANASNKQFHSPYLTSLNHQQSTSPNGVASLTPSTSTSSSNSSSSSHHIQHHSQNAAAAAAAAAAHHAALFYGNMTAAAEAGFSNNGSHNSYNHLNHPNSLSNNHNLHQNPFSNHHFNSLSHSPVSPTPSSNGTNQLALNNTPMSQLLPPTAAAAAAAAHYAATYGNFGGVHHQYASQMQIIDPSGSNALSGLQSSNNTLLHNGLVDLGQSNCIQDIHAAS